MTASILVVNDDSAIHELIDSTLLSAGYKVFKAADAESAQRQVGQTLPDLVLLNCVLPDISGIELARHLRSKDRTRSMPIVMLFNHGDEYDVVAGMEAGIDDYITKAFSQNELLVRIHAVLHRHRPHATEETVSVAGLHLNLLTRRVIAGDQQITLGPTEFRMLHFFMTYTECVHSRNHLREQVWGKLDLVEDRTIDVCIRRLRAALETTGHDALIQTVRGTGYFMSENTPCQREK